jgi:hypothetical protein
VETPRSPLSYQGEVESIVVETRRAQGLPDHVTDPSIVAAAAAVFEVAAETAERETSED